MKKFAGSLDIVLGMAALLAVLILFVPDVKAAQIRVPGDYSSIQAGIGAAGNGDVIIVEPDTYYENINFSGKAITVKSSDPNDPAVTSATIIDGQKQNSVVTFNNKEGPNSLLRGFTIQNGFNSDGGGIYCLDSSPTISHCTISENSASSGGGIFCSGESSPTITHCTIIKNSASDGGGIYCYKSSPLISNCSINENFATEEGGGVFNRGSRPSIINCLLKGNSASRGGAISCCFDSPMITNCLITGNLADSTGGGIYYSSCPFSIITNCTVTGNFASKGAGICCNKSSPHIINSILWGNDLEISTHPSNPKLIYCDIQGGYPGLGNIDSDPLFINPENGDYHLKTGSPCKDAGHPRYLDSDGSTADMGAYGGNAASLPMNLTVAEDGSGDFTSIQKAVDYALTGDIITVSPGLYKENLRIVGKNISIISQNGADSTIIDGTGSDRVIFLGLVGSRGIIDGFTLKGGSAGHGGGIYCHQSSPDISNCIISNNFASSGGGIYCYLSSPDIINCTISENSDGGIYCSQSSPNITHCQITENSAKNGGGICCSSSSFPTISNCTIGRNSATDQGGGIYSTNSSPAISDCLITENSALTGGGIHFGYSRKTPTGPSLNNCIVSKNSSSDGGGIYCYYSFPKIINCTITGNLTSANGGGIYNEYSWPYILNSIFWDNGLEIYADSDSNPQFSYCDIQGGYPGVENINTDPLFVDPENGDYHLKMGSPCIDAGHSRIFDSDDSPSDMGAYGGKAVTAPDNISVAQDGGGDFTSIQQAVNYSLTGDTITVFPGTYKENLLIAGKDISLISKTGSGTTIIDGSGAGSVIVLVNIGPKAVLDGFTIRNGSSEDGGGIYCCHSALTIANCQCSGNSAENQGGGIFCCFNSWPTISNCIVTENSAYFGGGICNMDMYTGFKLSFGSLLTITDCIITANSAHYGGGICCRGFEEFEKSDAIINNCTIAENSANKDGGGIYCNSIVSLTVSDCTITKNSAGKDGAGICCKIGRSIISNCSITENSARSDGGGIFLEEGDPQSHPNITKINNCNITENSALFNGGGILLKGLSEVPITNCIITRNSACFGGGICFKEGIRISLFPMGFWFFTPCAQITNCTITKNRALSGGGIFIPYIGGLTHLYHLKHNNPLPRIITNSNLERNFPNQIKGLCKIIDSTVQGAWRGRGNNRRNPR